MPTPESHVHNWVGGWTYNGKVYRDCYGCGSILRPNGTIGRPKYIDRDYYRSMYARWVERRQG